MLRMQVITLIFELEIYQVLVRTDIKTIGSYEQNDLMLKLLHQHSLKH